ncbi:MAG: winged helix-turn-helix domain-containing protein [Candidatus Sericytochromatia bacterium]|uniref:Winged helix-turn-helix domain-containing protein n=1 Tax=Candidatus Tanganyikabacteria bacterium TaxID=2961651 RepID=A0A937X2I1_9BACT|nr:winged helix-turn-helix domain-containing protein [Candidatus Tanganyikabacteria bacterium]
MEAIIVSASECAYAPDLVDALRSGLENRTLGVLTVKSAAEARPDAHRAGQWLAAVVEASANRLRAADVCRELKGDGRLADTPVIVVADAGDRVGIYEAFQAGATDIVSPNCDPQELALRIRAHCRRTRKLRPRRILVLPDRIVDLDQHQIFGPAGPQLATPKEVDLLTYLAGKNGTPASTEELLVKALGYPPRRGNPEVIRTHIRHLREKLESDPGTPKVIVNIPRVGYRLDIPDPPDGVSGR